MQLRGCFSLCCSLAASGFADVHLGLEFWAVRLKSQSQIFFLTSAISEILLRGEHNGLGNLFKAVVRDLGKTKSGKQKAAKEARKIVEMKGKQIKDELSLAMIQLFTKLLDEDSVEASTIDDVIQGPN